MAEPTFEDYIKEREMLDKNRNMENLRIFKKHKYVFRKKLKMYF